LLYYGVNDQHRMKAHYALTRADYERELDMTLAGSFPASDPPFWTLGVSPRTDLDDSAFGVSRPAAVDVVVREGHRFGGSRLASLGEAIAMMATLPLAILIAGAPVVALVWAIMYAAAWFTGTG
jgi:hypothetical protein